MLVSSAKQGVLSAAIICCNYLFRIGNYLLLNRWLIRSDYLIRNKKIFSAKPGVDKKSNNSEMQICGFNWLQKEGNMNCRSEWM